MADTERSEGLERIARGEAFEGARRVLGELTLVKQLAETALDDALHLLAQGTALDPGREVETIRARLEQLTKLVREVARCDYTYMGPALNDRGEPMEDMAVIRLERIERIGAAIDAARLAAESEGDDASN